MSYGLTPAGGPIADAMHPRDEERAYVEWARLPNRLSRGAMSIVSKRTGIKVRTLNDWLHRYQWRQRWTDEVTSVAVNLKQEASSIIIGSLPKAAARLAEIVETGSDRDAVFASRALRDLATTIDPAASRSGVPTITMIDKQLVIDAKHMTRDELFALERDAAQSNIERALESRVSKRQVIPTAH